MFSAVGKPVFENFLLSLYINHVYNLFMFYMDFQLRIEIFLFSHKLL